MKLTVVRTSEALVVTIEHSDNGVDANGNAVEIVVKGVMADRIMDRLSAAFRETVDI